MYYYTIQSNMLPYPIIKNTLHRNNYRFNTDFLL